MDDLRFKLEAVDALMEEANGLDERSITEAMVKYDKTGLTFTIQDASGKKHVGRVQGSGGVLKELKHLKFAIEQANKGKPMDIFEPKPGYVKVFTAETDDYRTGWHLVDIRGAKILASKTGPLPVKK